MSNPPRTPVEIFAGIVLSLCFTLDGHSTWGRLPKPLARVIMERLQAIQRRFRRLAERIIAGSYTPRRAATRRRPTPKTPRRPNPLPREVAWLVRLVQETAAYGSQLDHLFREPAMAALMAAAPAPMRRPLRSLCRMLGVSPPKILALPPRPKPPPAPPSPPPANAAPAAGRPPWPSRNAFLASLLPPGTPLPVALGGPPRRR